MNARSWVLLVVLILLGIYFLTTSGVIKTGGAEGTEIFGLSVGGGSSTAPISAREASKYRTATPLKAVIWKSDWESDPFFYAEAETTDALGGGVLGTLFGNLDGEDRPSMKLSGISWNGNVGMALINGDILEEGDRVAGYQITKIAFDHVIMRRGTSIVKVSLDD